MARDKIVLPASLIEDFYAGRRTGPLKFRENDRVRVLSGPYAGRTGAVVNLDITNAEPFYLVDFEDGTDELLPQTALESHLRAI